jgi:hypothetical protein
MLSTDPDLSLEKNDDVAQRMGERIAGAARLCRLQVGAEARIACRRPIASADA